MARQSARLLRTTGEIADRSFAEAVTSLKKGSLVSFPTETVYGLGGNALDESAVKKIFRAKGRPSSDPLIVHVLGWSAVTDMGLVKNTEETRPILRAAEALAKAFWPGPLTIVLPASDRVPAAVTAGSGYVGVRSPSHPIARRLLEESQLPVAAPSANRFGHTSPTRAEHVIADLNEGPPGSDGIGEILVMEGDGCDVGIESTVLRICHRRGTTTSGEGGEEGTGGYDLEVLRRGFIDGESILRTLTHADKGGEKGIAEGARLKVYARQARSHLEAGKEGVSGQSETNKKEAEKEKSADGKEEKGGEEEGLIAPGQLLTHYAPDIPAFILPSHALSSEQNEGGAAVKQVELKKSVLLDFSGHFSSSPLFQLSNEGGEAGEGGAQQGERERKSGAECVLAYRDLSQSGNINEASAHLFDALRWAERVEKAEAIFLPDFCALALSSSSPLHAGNGEKEGEKDGREEDRRGGEGAKAASMYYAVYDRCFRATSGRCFAPTRQGDELVGVIQPATPPPSFE